MLALALGACGGGEAAAGGHEGEGEGGAGATGGAGGGGGVGGSGGTGGDGENCETEVGNYGIDPSSLPRWEGVCAIEGSLTVWDGFSDLQFLSGFTRITGSLVIKETTTLTSLEGAEHLEVLGGLVIHKNTGLRSLRGVEKFDAFDHVVITENEGLPNLDGLQNLRRIEASLEIKSNKGLTSLDGLEKLSEVGGLVRIRHNEGLGSIKGLAGLERVGGDLEIESNPDLDSAEGLESLEEVVGLVDLRRLPWSTLAPLSSLKRVGLMVRLDELEIQTHEGLHNLQSIGLVPRDQTSQDLYIEGSLANLETIELPSLEEVGGTVYVRGLPKLESVRMPKLHTVGERDENRRPWNPTLSIRDNYEALQEVHLPALKRSAGGVDLSSDPKLQIIDLGSLEWAETLAFDYDSSLRELSLGEELEVKGDFLLRDNELTSLEGMKGLRKVGGTLMMMMLDVTDFSSLEGLEEVGETLNISLNEKLVDLAFPQLRSVGDLNVSSNRKLPNCKVLALAAHLDVACKCSDNSDTCP